MQMLHSDADDSPLGLARGVGAALPGLGGVHVRRRQPCASTRWDEKRRATFPGRLRPDGRVVDRRGSRYARRKEHEDSQLQRSGDKEDELAGVIEKGKNKMPAYGESMNADDIKALVA
jgi:hypothetical protein